MRLFLNATKLSFGQNIGKKFFGFFSARLRRKRIFLASDAEADADADADAETIEKHKRF